MWHLLYNMKIKDIMLLNPKTIKPHENILKAINLLISVPESSLPVVNKKGKVIGELNQKDLLLKIIAKQRLSSEGLDFEAIKNLQASFSNIVDDFFNKHEIVAYPDDELSDIIQIMYDKDISTIPIIDKRKKLVGILTDIAILKHYKQITRGNKIKRVNK
jgi:CBS domain-containing protein